MSTDLVCRSVDRPHHGWDLKLQECGLPASVVVVAACVHEHFREGGRCASHAEVIHSCRACHLSDEPHHCPSRVVEVRDLVERAS